MDGRATKVSGAEEKHSEEERHALRCRNSYAHKHQGIPEGVTEERNPGWSAEHRDPGFCLKRNIFVAP